VGENVKLPPSVVFVLFAKSIDKNGVRTHRQLSDMQRAKDKSIYVRCTYALDF